MHTSLYRKNKILLSDYNYKRDIQTRLLMAHLTADAVNVLTEILDGSLKTSVSCIANSTDLSLESVGLILSDLAPLKLFIKHGDSLVIDKEARKYLESQIVKYDDDYEYGMDFLQGLMAKIPPHKLSDWYGLSKTSDNLFLSIVEKNLATPQIYKRYLEELVIEFPHASKIGKDVLSSPDLSIKASDLMDKYNMTHEVFEECMLHLEFNCICCLGYRLNNQKWEEIVVPFQEWKEFVLFKQKTIPQRIETIHKIQQEYSEDFGFLKALTEHLILNKDGSEKMQNIMSMVTDSLQLTSSKEEWIKLPLQEQSALLYRQIAHSMRQNKTFNDKDLRDVQKTLKRVTRAGWIYFDDFFCGIFHSFGSAEPATLKNRGRKWYYALPAFTPSEKQFLFRTIFETFLFVGIVATGKHENQDCFCVTPYGRMVIED